MPHLDQEVVVIISTITEVEEGITITKEEVMMVVEHLMFFHISFHHTLPIRTIPISSLHHHSFKVPFKVPRMRDHLVRYMGRAVIQLLNVTIEWIILTKESTLPQNWKLWQQLQMLQSLKSNYG